MRNVREHWACAENCRYPHVLLTKKVFFQYVLRDRAWIRHFKKRKNMTLDFDLKERAHGQHSELKLLAALRSTLGIPDPSCKGFVETLPFAGDDCTAGTETELQVAVAGSKRSVDLPLVIEQSNYFANIVRRVAAGDTSRRAITELERYLDGNSEGVWENSWVRFPISRLSTFAAAILESDLLSDKKLPGHGLRSDADRFFVREQGGELLRLPVSYLLKIALAEVLGSQERLPGLIDSAGRMVMECFLNDNTSPETISFHVVNVTGHNGRGRAVAKEASKRFLLTQLLVAYANESFGLLTSGQKVLVYFSPHPPIRQKQLNDCISDSFYRELFMSPCLSGWDNGQKKHAYMCLCHQVLSRSQLNAVAKLRDAGIITRNLVVLPNVSNISLANNSTHVSLGSRKLTRRLADTRSRFTAVQEKYAGDLVIKIVEHFLPLFVGLYSAAPYRLDFTDFHPERALGLLPHELDYTHLRMIWRRWKKKAHLRILGHRLTPFGLKSLDAATRMLFRVKGDIIADFRLIDYPVAFMSSDRSPACDGTLGNDVRLKKDLSELGVFDSSMALYLPYRLREFSKMGFSGFEGRYYSLFPSFEQDMTHAVNLQILVTALAYKYVLEGTVSHSHIPDDPFIESERRQVFFGSAIGIPTFYVRSDTKSMFMRKLLARAHHIRSSRRYPGYQRVYNGELRMALAKTLAEDGADLISLMGLHDTVRDLFERLNASDTLSATAKITKQVLADLGVSSPLDARAKEFNSAAERYYRDALKRRFLRESLDLVEEDLEVLDKAGAFLEPAFSRALRYTLQGRQALDLFRSLRAGVEQERVCVRDLRGLINLLLISIAYDSAQERNNREEHDVDGRNATPVHRSRDGRDSHGIASVG